MPSRKASSSERGFCDLLGALLSLQFGQPPDGAPTRRRGAVLRVGRSISRPCDMIAEARDLAFEALDLAGLADGAREQLHHMGELRHLVGDVLHVAAVLTLRLDLALEPLEPARQAADRWRAVR